VSVDSYDTDRVTRGKRFSKPIIKEIVLMFLAFSLRLTGWLFRGFDHFS
jgi:hypothetical protein